jgi:hypothetical protein
LRKTTEHMRSIDILLPCGSRLGEFPIVLSIDSSLPPVQPCRAAPFCHQREPLDLTASSPAQPLVVPPPHAQTVVTLSSAMASSAPGWPQASCAMNTSSLTPISPAGCSPLLHGPNMTSPLFPGAPHQRAEHLGTGTRACTPPSNGVAPPDEPRASAARRGPAREEGTGLREGARRRRGRRGERSAGTLGGGAIRSGGRTTGGFFRFSRAKLQK